MARRYYYGYSRKSTKNADALINGLFKVGVSMASAYAKEAKRQQREKQRQVAAYNRFVAQNERELIRHQKQVEISLRREQREREKALREAERARKQQAKLQEQRQLEEEIAEIEDDNLLWTTVHTFIDGVVTEEDINNAIAKVDYEQNNIVKDGLFKKERPTSDSARIQAQRKADKEFDIDTAQKELFKANTALEGVKFDEKEPTVESTESELLEEAKEQISAFFPWTQKKLRKEYVVERLDQRYKELHDQWQLRLDEYNRQHDQLLSVVTVKKEELDKVTKEKQAFILDRTQKLYDSEVMAWEAEKREFYNLNRQNLQNVIDGGKDYIISAVGSIFPDEDLPMEYFVDFAYDEENNRILVDLDLPEIEDIPDRKIVLTPTGKKSIRMKGQTDLRSDYANCVLGLSMYVAHSIFNVSLIIDEVEICAFTQRKEANSAVATDQYVYVVRYDRELFAKVDFNRLSPIQIMDFFPHHFNMTKGYDMKQIDLDTAFDKMDAFTVADYDSFISSLPPEPQKPQPTPTKVNNVTAGSPVSSSPNLFVDDAPVVTFDKSSKFLSDIYNFIDRLSKDSGVNKHADNLNGVHVNWTSGNFTGDGNTNTYRGKLFFCSIVDLYRCLEQMHINLSSFTPPTYPFARYAIKIYGREDIQYYMLSKYEQVYRSLISMFKPMNNGIPVPDHVFLLAEVLCDYEKDMSWYNQYLSLIGQYIDIVRSSVLSSSTNRRYIDDYVQLLNRKGLKVTIKSSTPAPNMGQSNISNVDMNHLDPLFEEAARAIVVSQLGSTALIQRRFSIGYNRAGRLMDQLEAAGIVGQAMGSKPREVLISDMSMLESILKKYGL